MQPFLAGQSTILLQHCSKTKLVPTNVSDAVYKSDHLYIRQHGCERRLHNATRSKKFGANELSLTYRLL